MTEKVRRYKAVAIREESQTTLGIVEHEREGETTAIHSLYYPTRLSNRDTFKEVEKQVAPQAEDAEGIAILKVSNMQRKKEWESSQVKSSWKGYNENFDECKALAADAIKRQASICEKINEEKERIRAQEQRAFIIR